MNTDFVVGDLRPRAPTRSTCSSTPTPAARYLVERRGVPGRRWSSARPRSASPRSATCSPRSRPRSTSSSGADDVVVTVATDGAAMYGTEREKSLRRDFPGGFDAVAAAEAFGEHLARRRHRPLARARPARPRAHLQPRLLHLGRAAGRAARGVRARGASRRSGAGCASLPAGVGRADRARFNRDRRGGVGCGAVALASAPSALVCAGCGAALARRPSRCPSAARARGDGDDIDHVLAARGSIPSGSRRWRALRRGGEPNPFVRYRDAARTLARCARAAA